MTRVAAVAGATLLVLAAMATIATVPCRKRTSP